VPSVTVGTRLLCCRMLAALLLVCHYQCRSQYDLTDVGGGCCVCCCIIGMNQQWRIRSVVRSTGVECTEGHLA
jgi:hypothetical protein